MISLKRVLKKDGVKFVHVRRNQFVISQKEYTMLQHINMIIYILFTIPSIITQFI